MLNVLALIHGESARSGIFADVIRGRGDRLTEWSLAWGRPLPRELQPVPRKSETPDPNSSAIVVPHQPPAPPDGPSPGMPKGPIESLFGF